MKFMMQSPKNVAIFIDSLGGGGAERVMLNLAKGLLLAGHTPHIFCLESRKDHQSPEGIPVHVLYEDLKLKKIVNCFNITNAVKKLKDAVASIEKVTGSFSLCLANLDPTNKVVARCDFKNVYYVLHSSMENEIAREKRLGPIKYWRKLKAKRVMDGKDLIAVSKGVAEEAVSLGVINPKSVTTIYNPCDIDAIERLSQEQNPEIANYPYLIHVGRVVKAKRHDLLFKALKMVPDIKLVLLCKDINKVRDLAKKHDVADRIITPGFTNNPYNWIANAKLMVLSSDFEGLPTVLVESLICDTPIASTDCEFGPREILTGEMAEFISPVGDHIALADNINKALESPPSTDCAPILEEVALNKAVASYIALAN